MADSPLFPKIIWYARRGTARLGAPGLVGLALLFFGLAFYLSAIRPVQTQLNDLQRDVAAFKSAKQTTAANQVEELKSGPAEQLSAFYKYFPKSSSAPDSLAKLYEVAQAQGLMLDQGEYRLVHDRNGRLLRYEVTLPVKGTYPQMRKFMSQLLADIPYLSLDSVTFQRQKVGDATLESQIRFTLYLGEI